jgi:hypothetical protein
VDEMLPIESEGWLKQWSIKIKKLKICITGCKYCLLPTGHFLTKTYAEIVYLVSCLLGMSSYMPQVQNKKKIW